MTSHCHSEAVALPAEESAVRKPFDDRRRAVLTSAARGTQWRVDVGGASITTAHDAAEAPSGDLFVFAHGAGGHMADRGMLALAERFAKSGLDVVRFNFPYSEKKSRRPDPMPRLTDTIAAVVASARARVAAARTIIGGRSMGGRAASMLAADGFGCDALLLLAYPLHPAGDPQKLRDAHLARIAVPVLCVNGTRDALCRRDLMDATLARLGANWRMRWLEGADHAFRVTKAGGRSDDDVLAEIAGAVSDWRAGLR
jgi:predicted alpha/beta-hydrolase family hydrolase